MRLFRKKRGPDLSPETIRRVEILFPPGQREHAAELLRNQCGNNLPALEDADMFELERFRFAALKVSDGDTDRLERAIELAKVDWRDLLMAAKFGEVDAHKSWEPKPAGEPAEFDPAAVAAAIDARVTHIAAGLGFSRSADGWSRTVGGVHQEIRVITGLTSRTEAKYFVRVTIESGPDSILIQLPLTTPEDPFHQGYDFRSGDDPEALANRAQADLRNDGLPYLERLTSTAVLQQALEGDEFARCLRVEGKVLLV
ncbi:MAG: hypothetical protein U0Q16_09265 [Bryobacteraceae bacterium]